ncbi:diguanylate cyclase (GGDEF) domain-containing protein [Lachnospiraceae bacterium XBD2001]|nr:diguanylate cyclase (GGDEF) domain-containing protein [Lachnospiraceae bacterium XBD2001]
MRQVIIALDIFSLMVSFLVLYCSIFEVKSHKERNRSFTVCVILVIIGQFFNLLSWILDGQVEHEKFLFFTVFMYGIMGYVIAVYFIYYLWTLINETHPISKWTVIPIISISGPYILWMAYLILTGRGVKIVDGHYRVGDLYLLTQIYPVLCMIWAVVMILYYASELGRRKVAACFAYMLSPASTVIIHFYYPDVSFSYAAFGYAVLIVYVMVQAEQEREYKTRENTLIEASTRDSLTGLYNRRAYDMACTQMKKFDTVGIIFCDANGLKRTNDAQGHAAGDRLLLSIANGLIDIFSRKQVFRISGDEFVVMCPNMPYETFHAQMISLGAFVRRSGMPIASVGEAYGSGVEIHQLVKEAEQQMYLDKEQFYSDYPKMERRNR